MQHPVALDIMPPTPRAERMIEFAIEEARNLNRNYVGTADLLLGLLREEEGVAAQVLMNLGLDVEDVREELERELGRFVIDPAWLRWNNGTVATIVEAIVARKGWGDLPVLADALEEAGCADEEVLGHLRRPGHRVCDLEHRSGCWVTDRLLDAGVGNSSVG